MAQPPKRGKNEPEPRPIIIKKIIADGHGGHHGGAWKVAYADFVTAMMAFFLLMWLLGATTEKQRKGIADYFTPTLVEMRQKSAGANGPFGGDSIISKDNYPHKPQQTGTKSLTIPKDTTGGEKEGASSLRSSDRARMQAMKQKLIARMQADPALAKLARNVRFTETQEGLRIDLVDEADFSMFRVGTNVLVPEARRLIGEVARMVVGMPNMLIIRGHTDALPYSRGRTTNNWTLSTARAESTRQALADNGIGEARIARIEGVADRQPYVADIYDPKNRRMSITLAWEEPALADGGSIDPVAPEDFGLDELSRPPAGASSESMRMTAPLPGMKPAKP